MPNSDGDTDLLSPTSPSSAFLLSPSTSPSPFSRRALRSSLIRRERRSPNRKTVSFSSRSQDKLVCNVNDCWQIMQRGCEFVKIRANVCQFRRMFSLDADLSHIRWTPTSKKPHKARIAVESIKEVRLGRNTHVLRASDSCLNDLQEECSFSIIYGDDYECLDLVADSAGDCNIWVAGLVALSSNRYERPCTSKWPTLRERWLEKTFEEAAEGGDSLDERAATRLIMQINSRLLSLRIKQKIKEVILTNSSSEEGRERLTKLQFVELYKELATRPELYFLMVRYTNKDYLSCQDLRLFLETEQGLTGVTTDLCEQIINQYEPAEEAKEKNLMTIDGFTAYLESPECDLFDQTRSVVCQDMNQPFNRYFIASSHRTFLAEQQTGEASLEPLIAALRKAARLIELELWDPQNDEDEPQIQRGSLAQHRVGLRSALECIKESAFERSRFPLFVGLSVHCSPRWQLSAARLLRHKLGKKLYNPADDPTDWTSSLPTPACFLKKIILIGKKLPEGTLEGEVAEDEEEGGSGGVALSSALSDLIPPFAQERTLSDLMSSPHSKQMRSNLHVPLLSEWTALRLLHNLPTEFAELTRDFLVSVRPSSSRLDSSNLNPQELWNHGVQMVGLNYQSPGLMMDLQDGRFSDNGACGYVLKPEILSDSLFTPAEKASTAPQILHIRVLSGQQLPRPRGSSAKGDSLDPFVVVEIFGMAADCTEDRTKTVRNESMNPTFDESFQFQISVPELALVRLLVLDDEFIDDDFIGQYTIPFECLLPGYHHLHLLNSEGERLESATLFIHVAITNRRGGGKARKRGMSVKRKQQRVSSGMKVIGIKAIDDLFLAVADPLLGLSSTRLRLEVALMEWHEECGLGAAESLRQGMRFLHKRIMTHTASSSPPSSGSEMSSNGTDDPPGFSIDVDENELPILLPGGNDDLPEQLSRTIEKFRSLLAVCSEILKEGDHSLTQIDQTVKQLSLAYENVTILCAETGLRGQKAVRASENFTCNLRVLKAQLCLLTISRTRKEAEAIVAQTLETADLLGISSGRLFARHSRRFSKVLADPLHDSML